MNGLLISVCFVAVSLGDYLESPSRPDHLIQECGENEVYSDKKYVCPPQSCESIYTSYSCAEKEPEPGCNCIDEYLRNKDNICIPSDQCDTGTNLECGFNEVFTPNKLYCPPENCISLYLPETPCEPSDPEPGCICKDNHLRNSSEICVPINECPPEPKVICRSVNEVYSEVKQVCPPQTCASVYQKFACKDEPPEPGCNCIENYLRDTDGICIPAKDCGSTRIAVEPILSKSSPKSEPSLNPENSKRDRRDGHNPCESACTPTCSNPNPPNCDSALASNCCENGYILSENGGKCIRIEDCPINVGCNGDPNAVVKQCPTPCPSTCDSPNAVYCNKICEPIGCECAPGYLFNKERKCVEPEQCPGGNPCRENEVFVNCKISCPTEYCPTTDSRAVIACDPPNPCLSGCVCHLNHKRKSYDDDRCIVATDCPPVKCTRQNEEWSECPSGCMSEYCDAVDQQPTVCYTLLLNCEPACICKQNYFRNATEVCISADECRQTNPPDSNGEN